MSHEPLIVTVEAATLGPALRRLHALGGRTPGPCVWRLSPSSLRVEWKGGAVGMDAVGEATAAFRVEARFIDALAQTMPTAGPFIVRVHEHEVRLGTFVVPKNDIAPDTRPLLTVQADDLQVLMLAYRHPAATIEDAGLTSAVDEARARLAESTRKAARSLAWIGLDEARLAEWIDAHLRAVAEGKRTFRIAIDDPSKQQLGLFE